MLAQKDIFIYEDFLYIFISKDIRYFAIYQSELLNFVPDTPGLLTLLENFANVTVYIFNELSEQDNLEIFDLVEKNINYENFWSDLQEIFEDDLNFREKDKRYYFAFRNYLIEFAGFIDFKIYKSEFRKIFNDYQDPSIKAIGVDTQEDSYVVCPHCYNAEQVSAELGVIKCEKCHQEYNNPLAKICPSGISVLDD